VRDYEGLRQQNAVALIREDGFEPRVVREPSEDTPPDIVFDQTPSAGTQLNKGSVVEVLVSTGKPTVTVPDVRGQRIADAVTTLSRLGLEAQVVEVNSSSPSGTVTGQAPAPDEVVVSGATVRINVSAGPKQVAVPSVTGLYYETAAAQLQAAGFAVARRDIDSDLPADTVVTQDPAGNTTATKGATVTLSVSNGPQLVPVPDVTQLDVATARTTLQVSGFKSNVLREDTDDVTLDGVVILQDPPGNTQADPETTITLTVGRYVEPPPAAIPTEPTTPPPSLPDQTTTDQTTTDQTTPGVVPPDQVTP
jgi:serine/threonine-protein kinase